MIGTRVETFRIAGPVSDTATLIASIEAAIRLTIFKAEDVTGFRIDNQGHLVFCSQFNKQQTGYPFPPTAATLAQHIDYYISTIDEDDLVEFGVEITGYEEDYEIGFELYLNDYSSAHHRISDVSLDDIFAVKPVKIEWGK